MKSEVQRLVCKIDVISGSCYSYLAVVLFLPVTIAFYIVGGKERQKERSQFTCVTVFCRSKLMLKSCSLSRLLSWHLLHKLLKIKTN